MNNTNAIRIGIIVVGLIFGVYELSRLGLDNSFIIGFVLFTLVIVAVGYVVAMLLRKASYAATAKTANALKLQDGLPRKLLFFIGVPTLLCVLVNVLLVGGGMYLSFDSMNRYGANLSTIDTSARPDNTVTSKSNLNLASVTVDKQEKSFTVTISNLDIGDYRDNVIYTTDFVDQGEIEWASDLDILLVTAKEGKYIYYMDDVMGWTRVNRTAETTLKCAELKDTLKVFKGANVNGAFYVICPE